jgi:proliferating cell nuclear antigen
MSITTGETLEIIVQNQTKRSSSKFNLKLLDIDEDLLESPDLDTDIITTFPAVDFQRICRDMGNLADDISIFRDGNMLELSCRGDFADQSTSIECPDDIEGRVGNTFSLKYINLFTKATSMCSSVQLLQNSQDDSLPIILRYTIANLGDMKFYLSAKATDNDEI